MSLSGSIKRILNIVVALIVVGIALWLINTYVPMAGSIKAILNVVVVVATCVLVLQAVGLWSQVVRMWNTVSFHHPAPVPQPNATIPKTEDSSLRAERDAGSPPAGGRA